ncbi:DUF5302 domain-containing protein [Streptomyces sp. NPDC002765]|jgi:hypothetical protein
MTAESAAQQGSEPAGAGTSALVPDSDGHDDIKRKFREALARKCGAQADSAERRSRPREWCIDGHSVISSLRLCGEFGGQTGAVGF